MGGFGSGLVSNIKGYLLEIMRFKKSKSYSRGLTGSLDVNSCHSHNIKISIDASKPAPTIVIDRLL